MPSASPASSERLLTPPTTSRSGRARKPVQHFGTVVDSDTIDHSEDEDERFGLVKEVDDDDEYSISKEGKEEEGEEGEEEGDEDEPMEDGGEVSDDDDKPKKKAGVKTAKEKPPRGKSAPPPPKSTEAVVRKSRTPSSTEGKAKPKPIVVKKASGKKTAKVEAEEEETGDEEVDEDEEPDGDGAEEQEDEVDDEPKPAPAKKSVLPKAKAPLVKPVPKPTLPPKLKSGAGKVVLAPAKKAEVDTKHAKKGFQPLKPSASKLAPTAKGDQPKSKKAPKVELKPSKAAAAKPVTASAKAKASAKKPAKKVIESEDEEADEAAEEAESEGDEDHIQQDVKTPPKAKSARKGKAELIVEIPTRSPTKTPPKPPAAFQKAQGKGKTSPAEPAEEASDEELPAPPTSPVGAESVYDEDEDMPSASQTNDEACGQNALPSEEDEEKMAWPPSSQASATVTPQKHKRFNDSAESTPAKKKPAPADKISSAGRVAIIEALIEPAYVKHISFKAMHGHDIGKVRRHWREVLSSDMIIAFGGLGGSGASKAKNESQNRIGSATRLEIWKMVCEPYEQADWHGIMRKYDASEGDNAMSISKLKRHFRDVMRKQGDKICAK